MSKIGDAIEIIKSLGFPKAQQNDRTAVCLLAILDLKPGKSWVESKSPLIGVTPIMDFASQYYQKIYASNSREGFRKYSIDQFLEAGLILKNPDKIDRPVNSPKTVYQIEPEALKLIKKYGQKDWGNNLVNYLKKRKTLIETYSKKRKLHEVKVILENDKEIHLSPGKHSILIKKIIDEFAPKFTPGSTLIYVGDTGKKFGYFDEKSLNKLGVFIDKHGKMPDVVLYYKKENWMILVEAFASGGPVDPKRYEELKKLFKGSKAGLVYVTAFPSKSLMARYVSEIAWETEVWIAENPTHLIHFDGKRFLGPYTD
jgi:hypothetical protein